MKVQPINLMQNKLVKNKGNINYYVSENTNIQQNNTDKVVFKSVKVSKLKKSWSLKTLKEVRESLKIDSNIWKENLKSEFLKEIKTPVGMTGQHYEESWFRYIEDFASLGINELVILYNRSEAKKDALKKLELFVDLRRLLSIWKSEESIEESLSKDIKSRNMLAFLKSIQKVYDDQVTLRLIYPAQRIKEHKEACMPNCVMISDKNKDVNNKIINMIEQNFNGNFVQVSNIKNLFKELELAEENYKNKHEWNLLLVDNFEKTINPSFSEDWQIETMKGLMSIVAEKYHSTILFSTEQVGQLEEIALQPHRVAEIKTKDVISFEESNINNIKNKLSNQNCYDNTPIFTINCLLELLGKEERLNWEYTEASLDNVKKILEEELKTESYKTIFKEAYENLKGLGR